MNEYRGIPIKEDLTLPDDEIVIEGYDSDGRPMVMRFRHNPETGKIEPLLQ